MADNNRVDMFAEDGRVVVCKYRLSEPPSDSELGINNSVIFDNNFATLYAEPIPVESDRKCEVCCMCSMSFVPAVKGGYFTVAPSVPDVLPAGNLFFCSMKCVTRFRNKIEYKRRAAIFAAHGLPVKRCKLSGFPGYNCGMLADIEVKPQPSGDDHLTIGDYCGKLHATQGLALSAKNSTVLQLESLKVSLDREANKAAARIAKLRTAMDKLRMSKL